MNDTSTMSAQDIAERCAAIMRDADASQKLLGIDLVSVMPGAAVLSMTVTAAHLNGHGLCHGGFIYTLADAAFAYACNSRNQNTLAQHCSITYLAPGQVNDVLTASAKEVSLQGRSGIYDVVVADSKEIAIAHFRGHSRTIAGAVFDLATNV